MKTLILLVALMCGGCYASLTEETLTTSIALCDEQGGLEKLWAEPFFPRHSVQCNNGRTYRTKGMK
jgi:hypothetical protein